MNEQNLNYDQETEEFVFPDGLRINAHYVEKVVMPNQQNIELSTRPESSYKKPEPWDVEVHLLPPLSINGASVITMSNHLKVKSKEA